MFVKSMDGPEVFTEILNPPKYTGGDGIGWVNGSTGFYYTKEIFDSSGVNDKVKAGQIGIYYHAVGSKSKDDVLVYGGNSNEGWRYTVGTSLDGSYLFANVWKKTGVTTAVLLIPLQNQDANASKAIVVDEAFTAKHHPLGTHAGKLYMLTNESAPKWRVGKIDPAKPGNDFWRTVVPESEFVLGDAVLINGKIAASSLIDAASSLRIYETTGEMLKHVDLLGVGSLSNLAPNEANSNLIFGFQSIDLPKTYYEVDLKTFKVSVQTASKVPFDSTKYEVKEVFVSARDGTRVPVFISSKKGMKLDPNIRPIPPYRVWPINMSQSPYFGGREATWLEMGGGVAIAGVRGGGEYGENWHRAGMLLTKQNSFHDFVDVAQWLVKSGSARASIWPASVCQQVVCSLQLR